MNHIVLMGRLTADPELRETSNGTPVASFRLAVDRPFSSKDGEKKTDFINIVAWRERATFVNRYFTKGQMAAVAGRLEINDWTDKDGNKRYKTEVVADHIYFTGSKAESGGGGGGTGSAGGFSTADMTPVESSDFAELDEDDGELPF